MSAESVLIIEDDGLIRYSLRERLEAEDYRVSEAGTGEEGIAYLGDNPETDVAILDYRLPGLNGRCRFGYRLSWSVDSWSRSRSRPCVLFRLA